MFICALTAILASQSPTIGLHQTGEYRCPREVSQFYYQYPAKVRVPWKHFCPPYIVVGRGRKT